MELINKDNKFYKDKNNSNTNMLPGDPQGSPDESFSSDLMDKIKIIAQKVRNKLKNSEIDKKELENLYKKYNKIKNIEKFIKIAVYQFPKINCGLATLYPKKVLRNGEMINGKFKKNNHTFLLINNLIVDITSDQYGGPDIYVGPIKYPWRAK